MLKLELNNFQLEPFMIQLFQWLNLPKILRLLTKFELYNPKKQESVVRRSTALSKSEHPPLSISLIAITTCFHFRATKWKWKLTLVTNSRHFRRYFLKFNIQFAYSTHLFILTRTNCQLIQKNKVVHLKARRENHPNYIITSTRIKGFISTNFSWNQKLKA